MPLKSWRLKTYKQERINETCPWGSKFNWSLIRPVVINLFHMESVRSCGVLPLSKFDQRMRRKRNSTIDVDSHLPSGRTRMSFQFALNWMHEPWSRCTILLYSACCLGHIADTYPDRCLGHIANTFLIVALVMVPRPNTLIKPGWREFFPPLNDVVADAVFAMPFFNSDSLHLIRTILVCR